VWGVGITQAALAVIRDLMLKYKELREPGLMAVISPYKEQASPLPFST
jgi:hypothetical protein